MATPVNFTHSSMGLDAAGVLHIQLSWDSSTGSLSELSDCQLRERVAYDSTGFPGFFWHPRESDRTTPGNYGMASDIHILPQLFIPHQPAVSVARQHYQYCSPETNGQWTDVPGTYYLITRQLRLGGPGEWFYRIEKRSVLLGGFRFEREFRVW
jgi:hypothetical protein